jgi:hypothetical protein
MMRLPDLSVQAPSGVARPMWDLRRFLYRGAVRENARWISRKIDGGELGEPHLERMALLSAIKEELETRLVSGQSERSITSYLSSITLFFQFLEDQKLSFSLDRLEANYLLYSEHLFVVTHQKNSKVKKATAYGNAAILSLLFGQILGIQGSARLINRTRLNYPRPAKKAVSRSAEKQNLEDVFKLGNFLVDFKEGLSIEAILGALPIIIPIRPGFVLEDQLRLNAIRKDPPWLSKPKDQWSREQKKRYRLMEHVRRPVDSIEGTFRWHFVNLRVQAEFLIFIAQTGMNVAQAVSLGRGALKYKPLGDSWQVRCYKRRRQGEVSFRIYQSYKTHLEKFRSFTNYFFPDSDFLFPQFDDCGKESDKRAALGLTRFRLFLKDWGVPWVPPSTLRNARVNWLLRRSGDAGVTSEMAQHTQQVLRANYERPSQQRAMGEITRFWHKHDPIQQPDLTSSIISSQCNGQPESTHDRPASVLAPNCINPSGCLWCVHRRDLDSEDYVWSLASMRYLKSIEASAMLTRETVPADEAVARLSVMMGWYRDSSPDRMKWVKEAEQRIDEGDYHPNWASIIEFLE